MQLGFTSGDGVGEEHMRTKRSYGVARGSCYSAADMRTQAIVDREVDAILLSRSLLLGS